MKTSRSNRIAMLLTMSLCGGTLTVAAAPPAGMKMPSPMVSVEPVAQISKTAAKEYIGSVKAIDEVDLPSRISGVITGVKFKEGSLVKKGDLLFTIEDTTYRAKMEGAKAKVDQVEAELKYAQSNYQRQKLLSGREAVSKSNYEDAERLVNFTKARYDQTKAELLDTENDLSYTKIYAPVSGRIGEVKHTIGNFVNPNSTLLAKIVGVDPIQVKFSVSERDFLNLFQDARSPNQNLDIRLRLSNGEMYPYPGKIAFVDNIVDQNTGTVSIWTEFPNRELKLIPGGYATVLLSEKLKAPQVGVKISAIMADKVSNYVYVIDKDNMPVRRNVRLGDVVGDLNIVLSGLKAGETVITDGNHKVIPGVAVVPAAQPAEKEIKK